ncbi:MAG TPA: beta/gamma crystallin-related protein [Caulobacteraceae bacterium]
MRKTATALLAGAALAAIGTAAQAQYPYDPYYGGGYPTGYPGAGDTAILYELPNFQGRSTIVTRENGNLDGTGFNDRVGSVQLTGTWRLCEDANYRGRCMTFSGSVRDLRQAGIRGLSSLQVSGVGYPGGYPTYPNSYPGTGGAVQGRSVVFYPGPVNKSGYGYGYGSSSASRSAANAFCRSMGHVNAVYYDNQGGVLTDVLCRR